MVKIGCFQIGGSKQLGLSTKEGGVKNPQNSVNVDYEWPLQMHFLV